MMCRMFDTYRCNRSIMYTCVKNLTQLYIDCKYDPDKEYDVIMSECFNRKVHHFFALLHYDQFAGILVEGHKLSNSVV